MRGIIAQGARHVLRSAPPLRCSSCHLSGSRGSAMDQHRQTSAAAAAAAGPGHQPLAFAAQDPTGFPTPSPHPHCSQRESDQWAAVLGASSLQERPESPTAIPSAPAAHPQCSAEEASAWGAALGGQQQQLSPPLLLPLPSALYNSTSPSSSSRSSAAATPPAPCSGTPEATSPWHGSDWRPGSDRASSERAPSCPYTPMRSKGPWRLSGTSGGS